MAASTAMSISQQINEGRAAKNTAWANAQRLEKQGDREFASKAREAQLVEQEGKYDQSAALARAAASGVTGSESYQNLLAQIGAGSRYNAEVSLFEGKVARQDRYDQANLERIRGSEAKRAAQRGAVATAVKGAASMASLYGGGATAGGGDAVANAGGANTFSGLARSNSYSFRG